MMLSIKGIFKKLLLLNPQKNLQSSSSLLGVLFPLWKRGGTAFSMYNAPPDEFVICLSLAEINNSCLDNEQNLWHVDKKER